MSYTLQAIIAKLDCLDGCHLFTVELEQGFAICPFTDAFRKANGMPFLPLTDEGLEELPATIGSVCVASSEKGKVAYVEAEYFGGEGVQASVVWERGMIVCPIVCEESAINFALRVLGVQRGASIDEFDALGLGGAVIQKRGSQTPEKGGFSTRGYESLPEQVAAIAAIEANQDATV